MIPVVKENRYESFMNDLDAACLLDGYSSRESAFVTERCRFLVEQDVIQSFNILPYDNQELNCRIDAWGLKPSIDGSQEDSIVLIISLFYDQNTPATIPLSDFRVFCNKAKRFFQLSLKDDFRLQSLSYGSSEASFADFIYSRKGIEQQVTIIGITNAIVTSKTSKLVISENTTSFVTFRYDVWDFSRFIKIEKSFNGREPVDIDFVNQYECPKGIPALHVPTGNKDIDSYLLVLPGSVLCEMYEQWNERLLEQNPRTFLQFTGKINKGIRGTLINNPDKFFSYNNGISAVANGLETDAESGNIIRINNLQIVNGGQTTASIYNACYKAQKEGRRIEIEKVFVMMKLSVICSIDIADTIIPKISEYSNSQNKVASSAFSIRHPFHIKMEEYSRHTFAPANGDSQESLWYYERVQGQYKNAVNLCHTKSEKNKFESLNPKKQMFKSVDLAKYVMTFDCRPDVVCLGGQKCYALFSKTYLKTDEETGEGIIDDSVNQGLFREICCKALLFKALEARVSRGLRFVLVPYTLACLQNNLKAKDLSLNYNIIWSKQWDNEPLFSALAAYSNAVYEAIGTSMPETISIVSEWGKKSDCWRKLSSSLSLDISQIMDYTVPKSIHDDEVKNMRNITAIDNGVEAQTYVINKTSEYWISLYKWILKGNIKASDKELGILSYAMQLPSKVPSAKQSQVIINIEKKAIAAGFYV